MVIGTDFKPCAMGEGAFQDWLARPEKGARDGPAR
jgi:hypothetical protein